MANNVTFEKIVKEDFKSDEQDLIEKLAYPLNSFMQQTATLFNKGIGFNNLSFYLKQIEVEADYNGSISASFKSETITRLSGIICIGATNSTNSSISVASTPFVSFSESAGYVSLSNVTGLVRSNNIASVAVNGDISSPGHGLSGNQYVRIMGTGLADLDDKTFKIRVLDNNTFNIQQVVSAPATSGFFKTDKNKYKLNLLVIPS